MAKYNAMDTFQTNIEAALVDRGWSKQDLADHLGMDRSQLSKVIRGQNGATVPTLMRIADGLGVKLYELFMPQNELQQIAG